MNVDSVVLEEKMEEEAVRWSAEEIEAGREAKRLLEEDEEFDNLLLDKRALWLTVVNCKFEVKKARDKYKKWTSEMKTNFGIRGFGDDGVYKGGIFQDGTGDWTEIAPMFTAYAGCGLDNMNRSIMWIKTRPTTIEEEQLAIRAGAIYYTAIHADLISMRKGITLVLDTEGNTLQNKIGNESKLQRVYQSIPLRPQKIFILGAGWLKRTLINGIIAFASLFTKEKVIERVEFCELERVKEGVSDESLPTHRGGQGGGLKDNMALVEWVKERLARFPAVPDYF